MRTILPQPRFGQPRRKGFLETMPTNVSIRVVIVSVIIGNRGADNKGVAVRLPTTFLKQVYIQCRQTAANPRIDLVEVADFGLSFGLRNVQQMDKARPIKGTLVAQRQHDLGPTHFTAPRCQIDGSFQDRTCE